MAALLSLSPSRFAHLYRVVIGTSPLDDLLNARIKPGAELLRRPGMFVKTAALRVGFRDQQHFSKTLSARMGCSPSVYTHSQTIGLP